MDFDPGEGWREVRLTRAIADLRPGDHYLQLVGIPHGNVLRAWVREEPVPPLPTEPYTVIRATFPDGLDYDLILRDAGWAYVDGNLPRTDMIRGITGWEPLAEPRDPVLAEGYERGFKSGVKAVHDYLLQLLDYYGAQRVARKFEVES